MVRIDDSGDVTKCWLSPDELGRLERAAGEDGWEREVALQLMGRCGLRASEVNYPSDEKLRYSEKGDLWLFEVRGKNTKGGSKKIRDAWMPDNVADDIHKFSRERDFAPSDPWIDASTPLCPPMGEGSRSEDSKERRRDTMELCIFSRSSPVLGDVSPR
jgi:hypothetical protein